jgi:hypothetical protein
MNKKTKGKKTGASAKKLRKAKAEFEKIQKEIQPFIKNKPFKQFSTAGAWENSPGLNSYE